MSHEPVRKNLHILVTLLLMPVFMFAASGLVYWMDRQGMVLFGTPTNKGELIVPPRSMESLPLTVLSGQPPVRPAGQRKWVFLHVGSGHCDESCAHDLWETRQIRTGLGDMADYTTRAYLVLDGTPDAQFLDLLQREHKDLSVWQATQQGWEQLVGQDTAHAKLYFVDGRGFVMMRYRDTHTYKEIMKDMSFLIRHN